MQSFYLVIFLASLYGLMMFVKNGLRLSISYTQIPFVTVLLLMSVLYVAALFGLLLQVSWFVFLTGLVYLAKCLGTCILYSERVHLLSSPDIDRMRQLFPLMLVGILYFLNWFIFRDSMFSRWDEWFTWGLFTKVLTNYDLLSTKMYDITHSHYPRITSIFQYYFILFLNNGKFHEGIAIFAQTVVFSSAVPAFLCFRRNLALLLIPSVFTFYCIIHLFNMYGSPDHYIPAYAIYADSVLGLCWGMSVILYISNRNKMESLIVTGIVLFSIVQIKEMGVFFAFSTILVVTIDKIFFHTSGFPAKLKQVGTLIAVVVVSQASWNVFKHYNEIESRIGSPNLSVSYANVLRNIMSDPQDYRRTVAVNWLRSMTYAGDVNKIRADFHETEDNFIAGFGPTFAFSNFSLSPLYWIVIFMIFIFSSYSFHAGNTGHLNELRNMYLTSMICLAMLVLIYACVILFLYMSYFSIWEAVRLASFGRYVGTAFLGMFLVLFHFTLSAENKIMTAVFIILICLFTPSTILGYFSPKDQSNYGYMNDIYKRIDPVINEIKREDMESKILFINQGGNGHIYFMTRYRAFPLDDYLSLASAGGSYGYSVSTRERKDWEPWLWIASPGDLGRILSDMDYLVVWNDTEFFEMYGDVVERSKLKAIWKPAADGRLEKYVSGPRHVHGEGVGIPPR